MGRNALPLRACDGSIPDAAGIFTARCGKLTTSLSPTMALAPGRVIAMEEYLDVLRKYTVFDGRAGRREYWYFTLVNLGIYVVLGILDWDVLLVLFSLVVFLPSLAVGVRRLHDTGRSGWWLLISLIPLIGTIVLIVFLIQPGEVGDNPYGPDPAEATISAEA